MYENKNKEIIFKVFEDSACKEDLFNTLFSNKLLRHINLPDSQLSHISNKILIFYTEKV